MKATEITRDYVLFDNGTKLYCEFTYPKETPAYRYYVDFPALAYQLADKKLDEDFVFVAKPRDMVSSPDLSPDFCKQATGFCLKFGSEYGPYYRDADDVFYVPLHKKANPDFKRLDIEQAYQMLDRALAPLELYREDPPFSHDRPYKDIVQAEIQLRKQLEAHPIPDWGSEFCMTLKYGKAVLAAFRCGDFQYLPCQYAHAAEPIRYDPKRAMKITSVSDDAITFSNGKHLTYRHDWGGSEHNYADFQQIDDMGRNAVYYENELIFESVKGCGFRFGNRGGIMTFIPCYSQQDDAYYTMEIDLFYGGRTVLHLENAKWEPTF